MWATDSALSWMAPKAPDRRYRCSLDLYPAVLQPVTNGRKGSARHGSHAPGIIKNNRPIPKYAI